LRLVARRGEPGRRAGHGFRFLRHLGQIQDDILLLTVALDRDVCLTGGTERVEDLLTMLGIIQRGAVYCRYQVARAQPRTAPSTGRP